MKGRTIGVCAVVAVAAVLLIVLFATAPTDPDRQPTDPLDGRAAPAIEATDTKGRAFKTEDYRNKWLLVNFFATWCVPCEDEQPELVRFSRSHAAKGDASVVSVAYEDSADDVTKFFDKSGADWPVIAANTASFSLDYGVVKLPESYLIDPSGTVVHKFVGGVTANAVDAEISRAGAH